MNRVKLSEFDNSEYIVGKSKIIIAFWLLTSRIFFRTYFPWPNALKNLLLRAFGASIAENCLIKPSVQIKYPWLLKVGKNCWIGEHVWIDNLVLVELGDNVCLSQGCMLLTGSHDYKDSKFSLITGQIRIGSGSWICAKALVCPGVSIGIGGVLSSGSVATTDIASYTIAQYRTYRCVGKRRCKY
ncbi:WcaF family extracellular polysaccharide biosynthesis acetyltransferase [Vibrio sp. M260118]|uniref:WcaF family extracellular polysaccharide biosynthesis acetyltransferase n=1 Tax=Vibrio sp. M260118 TaxID=3020896 RepID=UPI003FCE7969